MAVDGGQTPSVFVYSVAMPEVFSIQLVLRVSCLRVPPLRSQKEGKLKAELYDAILVKPSLRDVGLLGDTAF